MGWEDSEQTLLLQCVLCGKAQKAYSTLSVKDSQVYSKFKEVVFKAYELVLESFTEFARELSIQFDRWCSVSQAVAFCSLYELLLLEQFKNTLPEDLAIFVTERDIQNTEATAVLADEYVLTHRDVKKNSMASF